MEQKKQGGEEAPVHGDVLEAILSYVPLVYLLRASLVSKSWNSAVLSLLSNLNRPAKPWLVLHKQSIQSGSSEPGHAYDPRSDVWVEISQPLIRFNSVLRSTNSNLLYALSSATLSFSLDPLHVIWSHVPGPRVWRVDPIVALVGSKIVVAGGGSEYEDDPLAVEVYDTKSREWLTCESMPSILKDSAACTQQLSIAADRFGVIVVERGSGMTYTFNPDDGSWRGPIYLSPDRRVFVHAIGFADDSLILAGASVEGVRLWKVNRESMECEGVGEMPVELVEKLKGRNSRISSSMSISATENFVYIYNSSEPEELVFCGFESGIVSGWGSVRNVAWSDHTRATGTMAFTCARVEIGDLQTAMKSTDVKLKIKRKFEC